MLIDSLTDAQVDPALALWAVTEHLGPVDPAELARVRRHDPGLVLAAQDEGGHLVGVVIGAWDGRRGSIHRLAVDAGARRRGVAQALVKELEDRLRARGCRRVSLLVFAGNGQGRGFWDASGYREFEDVVMFSRDLDAPDGEPHGLGDPSPGC